MDPETDMRARVRVTICGAVQGVGFRPWVYQLAGELGLAGWVNNTAQGVVIELEGSRPNIERFLLRIEPEKPAHSFIQSLESVWLAPVDAVGFEIRESDSGGAKTAFVLPDIATCPDCLREISDPANRRHGYPFTNCTHCGPRFSIITALPYDRPNTSMHAFTMCEDCRREYADPNDRRFHAQPNACPVCGPQLEWWNPKGELLASREQALAAAAAAIEVGAIVAVKGLGGFHLVVDARNPQAVERLRAAKHREEKPFAVMAASLELVRNECEVSGLEERLMRSPDAPIVLLRRHGRGNGIAQAVAPGNPLLGVMLPYTPLHHLLLARLGFPIVATSGNRSDEPICIDETEALERLNGIAEFFLVHNRPIVRPVDDSVARVILGRELLLRRARGYAPLPVQLTAPPQATLAAGAHLKNTIALSAGNSVFLSQHLGDLETAPAYAAFQEAIADFQRLYETRPAVIAADLHPDYLSTQAASELAKQTGARLVPVQHHVAHILSCLVENECEPPALGVAWDGTGYGTDGTIWGGEFFRVGGSGSNADVGVVSQERSLGIPPKVSDLASAEDQRSVPYQPGASPQDNPQSESGLKARAIPDAMPWFGLSALNDSKLNSWGDAPGWYGAAPLALKIQPERFAHLRTFPLPGGEAAVKEPRRSALGLLYEIFGENVFGMTELAPLRAFSAPELNTLRTMLRRNINTPRTSSIGRLFDAVASIAGLRQIATFEGQAAMELEWSADASAPSSLCASPVAASPRVLLSASPHPRVSASSPSAYPFAVQQPDNGSPLVIDWEPAIRALLADTQAGVPMAQQAGLFHNTLAALIVEMARRSGHSTVALSGGCFQNERLLTQTVRQLREEGFTPVWHQRVPCNDGGIALGQVAAVAMGMVDLKEN
ncbi:MAG: carbamoyltransferase HypF [Verrucomicrobiota bacterium]